MKMENAVSNAFLQKKIVPDVINSPPIGKLLVEYERPRKVVDLGTQIRKGDTQHAPKVNYEAETSSYYTLMMVDPDAPARTFSVLGEWQHWLVGNIPGEEIQNGEVIREYSPSGPPPFTGLHRYVLLLFKQEGKITFNEAHRSDTCVFRGRFSTRMFGEKYNLGNPVAGNFFTARY